ncbi:2-oxo acid dehydrogenase subunit E2 [Cryobacterium melibiosiphilum]|uniref:Dihydrolipoamide acetyltransferase component of pyruvate dehydrogenase complex n=1 Tax=Cryobacterium melibiosiphilum TaxID=995039 RepID=A0A3A5MB40_9MICO|nr:dihydrolipoamide acetyltransferase family protein [Cryobacterium melibiosiphilum]RJT87330.1 2-oxo acid dehydrogenase subunit E2 [Cryobacterium melibiosiphilum]
MIRVFSLPDLGEGLTESEIVAWHVAPGDTVTLNQHIADVETAKAVVELPSPFSGVVSELHRPEGVLVHVGDPIVSFEVVGADAVDDSGDSSDSGAPAAPVPTKREANLVGYGPDAEREGRPKRRARPGSAACATPVPLATVTSPGLPVAVTSSVANPVAAAPGATTMERPRSTPPVRMLARDLGVDLTRITGTGAHGVITRDDVRAVGVTPETVPVADAPSVFGAPSGTRESRTPIKSLRKLTAAAMVQSAFTAPHVTEFLTIDVTPTIDLLETINTAGAREGAGRVGLLAVVAQALCLAVARTPSVNTRWDEAAGEIVQFHYVNLGIAAATPRGLMVPVIADADRLGLAGLADSLARLTAAARSGTTTPAALAGGTITITNIGVFGIDAGTPILNPGEAAILAMGAIRRTPWEFRGDIALRQVMTLSLSFDHRLVDGEQGSRFLADVGRILANPGLALTMLGATPGAA